MSIRLSERDREIMLGLARNGFMRITHIQDKWFKGYWSCIKRLSKLKEHGYIDCTYIERNGKGIYFVTKTGLEFTNDYYGTDYKQYAKSNKILHHISCGEFYINFPFKILEYEIEFYLEDFMPDVYLCYEKNGREFNLLVEIDNTNRLNRFMPKIEKYNKYAKSGKYIEKFELFPGCLVVSDIKDLGTAIKHKTNIPFRVINYEELNKGGLKCLL